MYDAMKSLDWNNNKEIITQAHLTAINACKAKLFGLIKFIMTQLN